MTILIALLLWSSGFPPTVAPADTLTLDRAYRATDLHFPRGREAVIAGRIRDLRLENLDTRFLPSLTLVGQATYHSDVARIDISMPGFSAPAIAKDQYRAGLSVEQLVYDGGMTDGQRDLERVQADFTTAESQVASYSLRDQVEAVWFGVLMADAERESIDLLVADVEARRDQARSAYQSGTATSSNVDVLTAELLKIAQQQVAAAARRRAALDVLEELTGWTLADDARLELPETAPAGASRPEFRVFDLGRERLDVQSRLADRATRPKVSAFGDAAVGRPRGMNFFENDIGPFFSVGVRMAWPIVDWKVSTRRQEELALQADVVQAQEDAFRQGLDMRAARIRRDLESIERQLELDADLLELRARISRDAAVRLDNGTITATDYLTEKNAEQRAHLAVRLRRIQHAQARAALNTLLGSAQ